MPQTLAPLPLQAEIVDQAGAITNFFRLRWEQLRTAFQYVNTVANTLQGLPSGVLNGALAATAIYTTLAAGTYRVSYYIRKVTNDGVSSSLQVTLGWTESGLAQTEVEAALTVDAVTAQQSLSKVVDSDGATNITIAVAYASNTPGLMTYRLRTSVEQLI
jgi:hypothetical protein